MSRLESAEKIVRIVGVRRDPVKHIGRAVYAEQRVYVLHSQECTDSGIDLRKCPFSIALDEGIDIAIWEDYQDVPIVLEINDEYGDLEPLGNPLEEARP